MRSVRGHIEAMNVYLVAVILLAAIGLTIMVRAMWNEPRPNRSALRDMVELQQLMHTTGIMTAAAGDQKCALAFRDGRLFHAWCGSIEGEDAVRLALRLWNPGLTFDEKAQLPDRETITRPITSIADAA